MSLYHNPSLSSLFLYSPVLFIVSAASECFLIHDTGKKTFLNRGEYYYFIKHTKSRIKVKRGEKVFIIIML